MIARGLVYGERRMSHSEPRMSPLFDVLLGAAKAINQKVAQTLLRSRQIAPLVHRAQNVISGNLPVKRSNQPRKPIVPDGRKDFVFFHQHDASNCCLFWGALIWLGSRPRYRCNRRY